MSDLQLLNTRLNDRYEIERVMGRGSYSEIFVARDTAAANGSPHKHVVIKALNVFMQNDLDHDLERTLVENFQNEAVALDKVRHPNIISRLGHGTARDIRGTLFHYLVLELMPGGDLSKLTRERRLSVAESLSFLEQISAGIAHAHRNNVIHRDIKPQNMLLSEDRKVVKIADFGVARFGDSENPITRVGTNIYAPPEHSPIAGGDMRNLAFHELTPAADIYSLAKTTYVLFTSETPRIYANYPITDLPFAFRKEVWAKDLLAVLNRATQNDPRNRYQTIDEFWQSLSAIESGTTEIETRVSSRKSNSPQPQFAKGYTPQVPSEPQFNTTRDLKLNPPISISSDPPLPTQINERDPILPSKRRTALMDEQGSPPAPQPKIADNNPLLVSPEPKKRKRIRNFAIYVILLSLFAGGLYATYNYFSSRGTSLLFGSSNQKLGTALTNINIRTGPSNTNEKIGVATINSRIRVVNTQNNWYQIVVLEYGAPKPDANGEDSGWVYGKYIKLDQ